MISTRENRTPSSEESLRQRSILGQAVMLGTNIAAGMILFTLLGLYLDHKRGTSPFWTVGGVLMGFSYAAYEFWTTLRLLRSQDQKKTEKAGLDGAPSPENSRELGKK